MAVQREIKSLTIGDEVFIETNIHQDAFYAIVLAKNDYGIEVRLTRKWREFVGSYSDGTIIFFPWHTIDIMSPAQ